MIFSDSKEYREGICFSRVIDMIERLPVVEGSDFLYLLEGGCWGCIYLQVQIQDLVKGGAPASVAESCRRSEAESRGRSEQYAAGVQGPLKGPGSFWVFNAQICILTHSRDSFSLIFDIYFDTKSL